MNKLVKKKWIKALTNGKYLQAKNKLRVFDGILSDGFRYCCLGVLQDIYCKTKRISWSKAPVNPDGEILPFIIADWAGLKSESPEVVFNNHIEALATLNDEGKTFSTIAQLIKEQL